MPKTIFSKRDLAPGPAKTKQNKIGAEYDTTGPRFMHADMIARLKLWTVPTIINYDTPYVAITNYPSEKRDTQRLENGANSIFSLRRTMAGQKNRRKTPRHTPTIYEDVKYVAVIDHAVHHTTKHNNALSSVLSSRKLLFVSMIHRKKSLQHEHEY